MRNECFEIELDRENGTIQSITVPFDKKKMNWCLENSFWGRIVYESDMSSPWRRRVKSVPPLISFTETQTSSESVYQNDDLSVSVSRYFADNGNFCERYVIKNLRVDELFLEHGALGIELPFNEVYTYSDDCMSNRCNTHIWCGGEVTYVNAMKMGESKVNLGLVLTNGSIKSYSVKDLLSNHRGVFVLDNDHIELLPGEEYIISWEVFVHSGKSDFEDKRSSFGNYVGVFSDNFTVFENEKIRFWVKTALLDNICITCDGDTVEYNRQENGFLVEFLPRRLGAHRFDITVNSIRTYAEFFVAKKIEDIIKKRIDFIIENQQYLREGSALDGAFLAYDTKEKCCVFNSVWRDHNACRERTAMPLLIAKYLQSHNDERAKDALLKYLEFAFREIIDMDSGEVFDGIRKNAKYVRLYNAPWMITLLVEVYYLLKDKKYLRITLNMLRHYYSKGAYKFYPNGLFIYKTITAFRNADMLAEADEVKEMFSKHVDNMVANGLSYPKHEVNFEQTIVSPAATFTSEMAYVTGNEKYLKSAAEHVLILERFSAGQPSFHLYEIPIRYWDDFWFGKGAIYGDVFPHYWSCLSARSFAEYYRVSADDRYKKSPSSA